MFCFADRAQVLYFDGVSDPGQVVLVVALKRRLLDDWDGKNRVLSLSFHENGGRFIVYTLHDGSYETLRRHDDENAFRKASKRSSRTKVRKGGIARPIETPRTRSIEISLV